MLDVEGVGEVEVGSADGEVAEDEEVGDEEVCACGGEVDRMITLLSC